jgi:hypothetical protein
VLCEGNVSCTLLLCHSPKSIKRSGRGLPVAWITLGMENEEKEVDEWGGPWGVQSRPFDRLSYQGITSHEVERRKLKRVFL